jgi:outer membrane lipoprotein-sorting protein
MLAVTMLLPGVSRLAGQETAREIIDRVDRMLQGESSEALLDMEIRTEHWTRTLEMRVWSLGTDRALVRVISPQKDAGMATLKVGNEVWNYLPRVDRTLKIPPSMMMGSWMGSHFTNDDLVKESRMIDDYDIEMGFSGERDGTAVWEFDLKPKPEAPVVWGRIVERIRKSDLMPIWAKYYDEDGVLVRTLTFGEYKRMSGRMVPTLMRVEPADKPDEVTQLTYRELKFDVALNPEFFSLRNLREAR